MSGMGTSKLISVPIPGCDDMVNRPLSSSSRSFIPSIPKDSESVNAEGVNPRPLS